MMRCAFYHVLNIEFAVGFIEGPYRGKNVVFNRSIGSLAKIHPPQYCIADNNRVTMGHHHIKT